MAAAANSPSSTLIAINITAQTPIKLSSNNYCAWRMQTVLLGYELIGYVDGSHPRPATPSARTTAADADAYSYWICQDQLLLNAIVGSLSL